MAVPFEHDLHYRCNFELHFEKPNPRAWGSVVRTIRKWILSHFPEEQPNPALRGRWFYIGGEWKGRKQPRIFLKTSQCIGSGSQDVPQWWAVRFEHPDSEVGARQWRTDIGITITDERKYVFSLSTIHWLAPGFIGQEPPDPVPTAPKIVAEVLNSKYWTARAGSERLTPFPFLLRDGTTDVLLQHLEDDNRACPLVLVAKDFSTGNTLLDPRRLARLLAGAAVVWESESSWVDKELEQKLGREFSCWNGMVRVYKPHVNLKSASGARRHRYFDKEDILSIGVSKVEELLVRGIVRRSRMAGSHGIATLEDVQGKLAETRFAEELKRAKRGSQEWTELLEQEVERLTAINKEYNEKMEVFEEIAGDADAQRDELQGQVARSKFLYQQAEARAIEAESARASLEGQVSLWKNLEELPDSVTGVLELIEKAYPNRIVFTERAKESAREAKLKNINIAWKCLRAMATNLYDLHFQDKLPMRELAKRFQDLTGFELAVGESETTKKQKRLSALRTDTYNGREIDISPHIRYGRSPGNMLRVHYYAHPKDKVIIVGHCGDHLDTVRTN